MWKNENKTAPIVDFLGWTLFISLFVQLTLFLLEPWSISYMGNVKLTLGYTIYAVIGMFFSTPAPLLRC